MKKLICIVFTIATFFTPFFSMAVADDIDARAVMEKFDSRDDGDRSIADMKMVLIDRHGKKRIRTIRSFGIDQGKDRYTLMFFLSPADVKDTGFLTYDYDAAGKDDDQWLYLPAMKKTKRIASSDKSDSFMGSDFTYADLTKWRLDDHHYSFNKKHKVVTVYGQKTWVIDSTPSNQDVIEETGYTRSILFVRQDNYMVVRGIHFVEDGGYVKYFDVKRMAPVNNIWTNLEIHMTKKKGKQTVHRTILTFNNVQYHQKSVNENMFTVRRLEKGL